MDKKKTRVIGISWFILSLVSDILNDILLKYTGSYIFPSQIIFLRFSIASISLIPFIIYHGTHNLQSIYSYVHLIRGIILFCGMIAWSYGITFVPLTTATIISFSISLFVLVFAIFFLKEKVTWQRWLVTIIGFLGVFIIIHPGSESFILETLILVLAAIIFAFLDIVNKKFVKKESIINMLFYPNLVITILSIVPAIWYWHPLTLYELSLFLLLGINSNLILFFLLKSFALVELTAVVPYRYLEFIISVALGYWIFGDIIAVQALCGGVIVILATIYNICRDTKD